MIFKDDRALLDAFRRGDRAAMSRVYRWSVSDVSTFLRRGFSFQSAGRICSFRGFRGGYEMEAAVQEVYRKAFEERARMGYNGIDPYKPYLFRIAQNLVINDLKSKQPILFRYRSGAPVVIETRDEGVVESASESRSAEDLILQKELSGIIARFMETLDEREKGVFRTRFEEGLSAESAAESLGLTRSKVRTTEEKLRARFLDLMHRHGYLETFGSVRRTLPTALLMMLGVI